MRHTITHITIVWILSINLGLAQCPGAQTCEGSGVLCSIDALNGFSCNNPGFPNVAFPIPNLCFGAGVPHNLNWWAFIGSGIQLTLTFNFNPTNCELGQGIQAGVFEGSCDGSNVWDCNAACNTSIFSLSGATKACEIYFVWVDGCNGDVCTYTMSVSGNGGPLSLQRPMPSLQVKGQPCACGTVDVCFPGYANDCSPYFQWTVDGIPSGGPHDECVELMIPENVLPRNSIEVCLTATIGNPFVPESICDQDFSCITISPLPVSQDTGSLRQLCFRNEPFIWHGDTIFSSCVNPPCSTRIQLPNGCCVDSLVPFQFLPIDTVVKPLLRLPISSLPYNWNGQIITRSCINPPCSARVQLANGCIVDEFQPIEITLNNNMAQVKGTVYFDKDGDCQYDSTDRLATGISIEILGQNGIAQTFTDSKGGFWFPAEFDQYYLRAYDPVLDQFACPDSTLILVNQNDSTYCQDLFLKERDCYLGRLRLLPLSGRNRLRCDPRRRQIRFEVINRSADTLQPDTAVVTVDSLFKFVHAEGAYRIQSDREIMVVTPQLLPGQRQFVRVYFESECPGLREGHSVCFQIKYLHRRDCNNDEISDDVCGVIRNSHDPNDLTVTPTGVLKPKYIARDQVLDGLIRFHNTGSDTAYDIRIILNSPVQNVIDNNTIKLIDASAQNVQMTVHEDHIEFYMFDIKLPHDMIDTVNSHGYVRYSFRSELGVPFWTKIRQRAAIYFDYNLPIFTNFVHHTIAGDYLTKNLFYSICKGDTILGTSILNDTIIHDTSMVIGPDKIESHHITVHNVYHNFIDTILFQDDLLFNRFFHSDTHLVEKLQTAEGCDSITHYLIDASYQENYHLEICEGESVFGDLIYPKNDTTLEFWIQASEMDTLKRFHIVVHDTYHLTIDTTLNKSDSLLGRTFDKDTIWRQELFSFDGCDSIITYNVKVLSTGTSSRLKHPLLIFPNPVQDGKIHFESSELISNLQIFTSQGKTMYSEFSQSKTKNLDVTNWERGIYYYQLTVANQSKKGKIVIQ